MIISLYFHKKQQLAAAATTTGIGTTTTRSCVHDLLQGRHDTSTVFQSTEEGVTVRHFPVILVFHTVVSISLWFMQYQNQQHAKNMEMVKKLKQDLTEAQGARGDMKKKR